jgi:uncharacterized SAM-binding protein YcdF (DUF218 family)
VRLLRLGLLLALLAHGVVGASALWFARSTAPAPTGDVILVFGAGMTAEGRLDHASRLRVETGAALWHAGAAPRILFSGGAPVPGGPSAADQMAALAGERGVPEPAMLREGASHSTLQNALFSAGMLPDGTAIIAVTEGFHMARAILSSRWAGLAVSGHATSTAFRPGLARGAHMLAREVAAWGFNLVRVAAYEGAGWIGLSEETRTRALR